MTALHFNNAVVFRALNFNKALNEVHGLRCADPMEKTSAGINKTAQAVVQL